jgi:hypothetical protein
MKQRAYKNTDNHHLQRRGVYTVYTSFYKTSNHNYKDFKSVQTVRIYRLFIYSTYTSPRSVNTHSRIRQFVRHASLRHLQKVRFEVLTAVRTQQTAHPSYDGLRMSDLVVRCPQPRPEPASATIQVSSHCD